VVSRTPWADRIADRVVDADALRNPPAPKPPKPRPAKPTPVDSGRAVPRPRPIPAEGRASPPQSGGFLDRFIEKLGDVVGAGAENPGLLQEGLNFLGSQGLDAAGAVGAYARGLPAGIGGDLSDAGGDISEFLLGPRNPLDFPGEVPGNLANVGGGISERLLGSRDPRDLPQNYPAQARDTGGEVIQALEAIQELGQAFIDPDIQAAVSTPVAGIGQSIQDMIQGDASLLERVLFNTPNFGRYPDIFRGSVEQNREANQASREILGELVRLGMTPFEAEEALAESLGTRPISSQIVGALVDPFLAAGAIRGGVRAARNAPRVISAAADVASNAGTLVRPRIAQAAGGLAPRFTVSSENMAPGFFKIVDAQTGDSIQTGTIRSVLQSKADELNLSGPPGISGVTPLDQADTLAAVTSVQGGLPGEFAPPAQQVGLDLGGGGAGPVQPLIPTETVSDLQRLAAERRAGQQGFDLADEAAPVVDDIAARESEIAELSPIDRAELKLDEANANLEATQARGTPAPLFGTSERAAFDAERQARVNAGIPVRSKKAEVAAARENRREARDALKALEKANPSLAAQAVVETSTVAAPKAEQGVTHLLPRDLSGARPRFQSQPVIFEDDLDKAFYIIAQANKSKRDADYLRFVMDATGLDQNAARLHGRQVRARIKALADGSDNDIRLPSTVERVTGGPAIGDEAVIRGVDSFAADVQIVRGARYELYSPAGDVEIAAIRVVDAQTGREVSVTQFPNFDQAISEYDKVIDTAHGKPLPRAGSQVSTPSGSPATPVPGGGSVEGPAGPPPRNTATGDPFDPDDGESVLAFFRRFLQDPTRAEEWQALKTTRAQDRHGRFLNLEERIRQLREQGVPAQEAIDRAVQDTTTGPFQYISTGIQDTLADAVTNALYERLAVVLADEGAELLATRTALTNALSGKPIPNDLDRFGQTAFTRLERVFGEEITTALDRPQTLKEVIAFKEPHVAPRAQLLGELDDLGRAADEDLVRAEEADDLAGQRQAIDRQKKVGQRKEAEAENAPTRPVGDLGAFPYPREELFEPVQRPIDEAQIDIPSEASFTGGGDARTQFQKDWELQEFINALKAADGKTARTAGGYPPGDIPPDDIIKQFELMPDGQKRSLLKAAKEAGMTAVDFGNFLKANLASFDMSFWRQQGPLIFGNFDSFIVANVEAFRSLWSQSYADKVMKQLESDPITRWLDELDIDFMRPWSPKDIKEPVKGLEEFGLFGATRPIQRLTAAIPWVGISSRAHVVGTNVMNHRIFRKFMENQFAIDDMIGRGDLVLPPGEVLDIRGAAKAMGTMLEDMSGRAQVPQALQKLTPAMNAGFFSLRLNLGRLLMGRHLFSSNKYVRRQAWKNLVSFVTVFTGIELAGERMGLWEVEKDPRSSDFMLMRVGKIRVDPWGGAKQFLTFFSRLLPIVAALETVNLPTGNLPTAGAKSTETGQVNEGFGGFGLERLWRSKSAPLVSLIWDTVEGENFLGDPVDHTSIEQWSQRVAPLAVQDLYEAFQNQGGWSALTATTAIFGAGILVYDLPRWADLDEYYAIKGTELVPGVSREKTASSKRQEYRTDNPLQDARLFVRGQVRSLKSPRARQHVLEIMSEHKVDPKDVPGWEKQFVDRVRSITEVPKGLKVSDEAKQAIKHLDPTKDVQAPVQLAPVQPTPVPATPAPPSSNGAQPNGSGKRVTGTQILDALETAYPIGLESAIRGLAELWKTGTKLTDSQRQYWQVVFEILPMGQTNFKTWVKQTLRQSFESEQRQTTP
jgi:hypothetical protein